MAVFQPLYHAGGIYSADTDRRVAAAIFDTNSDGKSVSGIIPSFFGTNAMKASTNGSSRVISIKPGMCVIPDQDTQTVGDAGVYVAGISSDETITLAVNSTPNEVVDTIYAVVDETAFVITNKIYETGSPTGKVTLTTDIAHNFSVGETVVVAGVDNIFDGTYTITEVTTTSPFTFSYAKSRATAITSTPVTATVKGYNGSTAASSDIITKQLAGSTSANSGAIATITTSGAHGFTPGRTVTVSGVDGTFDGTYVVTTVTTSPTNTLSYVIPKVLDTVNSTSVTQSAIARARVPFAIRAERAGGSTLNGKTKIQIATVGVPGGGATVIPVDKVFDKRSYANLMGGVALYSSTAVNDSSLYPTGSAGRLRYDTATSNLQIYDVADLDWKSLYNTTSNHHDSVGTDASDLALHHTLGGNEFQAAKGNHMHDAAYVGRGSVAGGTGGFVDNAPVAGGFVRNIYMTTGPAPTGMSDGDVWFIYTP